MKSLFVAFALLLSCLGAMAQSSEVSLNDIYKEPDPVKKEALSKQYAAENSKNVTDAYFDVAVAYAKQKNVNTAKVAEYTEKMGNSTMYNYIIAKHLDDNGAFELAEVLIKKCLNGVKDGINASTQSRDNLKYKLFLATVLNKQKKFSEAVPYLRDVYLTGDKSFDYSISDDYINALVGSGKLREAFPVMDERLRLGKAAPVWRKYFKAAYNAAKGSGTNFEELMASIKSDSIKHKKEALFTWKDVNGETVSLQKLAGKVIVLDFWATWCGPCKASFPMMQELVNKYKNDPDVVFLFVATRETANALNAVKKYIADNHYTFRVLLDQQVDGSAIERIRYLYNVSSIPEKIVIDAMGNVAARRVGFIESEREQEMVAMAKIIEDAKQK